MTLEELLNKLIEKGWKPRDKEETKRLNYHTLYREVVSLEFDNYNLWVSYSIRDLVSKESWLWQFVCENEMVNEKNKHERILDPTFWEWWADCKRQEHDWNYGYRLIESALKDEDKLEEFLLENIKVE